MADTGTIYLIHIDKPIAGRASHYLGWAKDLDSRLARHASGNGSRLMAAAVERGITYRVVRTWPGDRNLERKLKNRKQAAEFCPECQAGYRKRYNAYRRDRHQNRKRDACTVSEV